MAVSEARGGKRRGWIIAGGAAAAAAGWIFLRRLAGQMLLVNAAMMPFISYVNVAYFTLRARG